MRTATTLRPRAATLGALVLLALVGALVTYKTSGSLITLAKVGATRTLHARPEAVPAGDLPPAARPLARTVSYLAIVWPALAFGVLIGAAVRAFVPSSWVARALGGSAVRSQLLGGLAGAPLMLCSCCIAPVFAAVHERTQRAGPAGALLLASPSLNPAALALTFMLFTPQLALTRTVMALVLVFGVTALAARTLGSRPSDPVVCELEADPEAGPLDALRVFGREVIRLGRTTLPLILLGVLASSLLIEWVPIERLSQGRAGAGLVLLAALLSVPIALPTFAEIPLALGLIAVGAPAGAALALLIAGPAINLPSLFTLRRMTNTRYAVAIGTGTFLVAATAGLLV